MSRELSFYIRILRIFALTLSIKVPIIVYSTLFFAKNHYIEFFHGNRKGRRFYSRENS